MSEILKKWIKSSDILSPKASLMINSKFRFENIFGGCISFLTLLLITASVIYFFIPFINRNSPNVSYNQEISSNPNLEMWQYPFIFSLLGPNKSPISDLNKFFSFQIYRRYKNKFYLDFTIQQS